MRFYLLALLLLALLPISQAGTTLITRCPFIGTTDNTIYTLNTLLACPPDASFFTASNRVNISLNFTSGAGAVLLGLSQQPTGITCNNCTNFTVRGNQTAGGANIGGNYGTDININQSWSTSIINFTGGSPNAYNVRINGSDTTTIYNSTFGSSAGTLYIRYSNYTTIGSKFNPQNTGFYADFAFTNYIRFENFEISKWTTAPILFIGSDAFSVAFSNTSLNNNSAGAFPIMRGTIIRCTRCTLFGAQVSSFANNSIGVELVYSNASSRTPPVTTVVKSAPVGFYLSTFTGFDTQAIYVHDATTNISMGNITITNSNLGLFIENATNTTAESCTFNNNSISVLFGNATLNSMIANSTFINETGNIAAVLSNSSVYAASNINYIFNSSLNRSNTSFTIQGGYIGYGWHINLTVYCYGANNWVSANVSNVSYILLNNTVQMCNQTTWLGGYLQGLANYTSPIDMVFNTSPLTLTANKTGLHNAVNVSLHINSSPIYMVLQPNRPPTIYPMNTTPNNNSIEASNFSLVRPEANLTDADGDAINKTNCSVYVPSGAAAYFEQANVSFTGATHYYLNVSPVVLGEWSYVCRAMDSLGANSTNTSFFKVADTIPPKFAWLSVPPPGNYSNASTVLHLNGSGTDSFNVSAVNLSANWSGFAGFLMKTCTASAGYYYNLSCAYDWNLSNVPAGVYQICGGTNDTAPLNDSSCFLINITTAPPVVDNPPTSNMTSPLNGTVFSFSTGNSTLNVSLSGVPLDDNNFTNFSIRVYNSSGLIANILNLTALVNGTVSTVSILLPNGIYNFSSSVCDAAAAGPQCFNNETNWTFTVNLTAPAIFLNCSFVPPTPANGSNVSGRVPLNVSCSNFTGSITINISTNASPNAIANCTGSPCFTRWRTSGLRGEYVITSVINDTFGNSLNLTRTLFVNNEEDGSFLILLGGVVGMLLWLSANQKKKTKVPA